MSRVQLEEAIQTVWSTKEDIELLYRFIDSRAVNEDEFANALLGIATLHELRSKELFSLFEQMVNTNNIT